MGKKRYTVSSEALQSYRSLVDDWDPKPTKRLAVRGILNLMDKAKFFKQVTTESAIYNYKSWRLVVTNQEVALVLRAKKDAEHGLVWSPTEIDGANS